MTNSEIEKALEDFDLKWFGIQPTSSLRNAAASSSDLQNSNLELITETLHVSPSAPNLRQRSTLKTGHLRRKPTSGDLTTEKPPRGHVRRISTSSIDLSQSGSTVNTSAGEQDPQPDGSTGTQALPPPLQGLGRPPRPDAPSRASARSLLKSQNAKDYAERRKAWRARLEATMAAPRLYTATLPIPSKRPPGSRAASVQSTPSGSPKPPHSPLVHEEGDPSPPLQQQHPAVPAVWVGHSSDQAPQDFSALDDAALRKFIQQAGSSPPPLQTGPASLATMNHADLVITAQNAKATWEVERIIVGCSLPEQILRVQKSDCTDPVLLKAAWKKLAFQVHPDRCSAEGASVAMAIAKDAFDILAWRAEQYQAAVAFELAQNDGSKAHTTAHVEPAVRGTAAGAVDGDSSHKHNVSKAPPRPLSAPAEIVAGGGDSSSSGPQPPLKVRVKLKVKKVESRMATVVPAAAAAAAAATAAATAAAAADVEK